ncbi:FtsK/SpoIIIE domain-containing protein [Catenulispora subtropica]|uniref:Cell division protein FtsK n=1 Tax=Catenulispora subtropica TaxID=450798 RepID=A0ABN2QME1_9ACTN
MTETYEHDNYEPKGARVIAFPTRGADGDDGLGVPDWVNADQTAAGGLRLSEAATDSHVIEGVIVDRTAGPSRAQRRIRRRQQLGAARAALSHPAVRGGGRQLVYLALGLRVAGRRYWQSRTTVVHEQMMRSAVARNDHTAALEWEERAAIRRFERHERRMELLSAPVEAARAVFAGTVGGAFLLLVAGIALWLNSGHIADVATPFEVTATVVKTTADILRLTWRPLIALALLASLLGLWQAGRNDRDALPVWLAPAGQLPAADDAYITPSIVVVALRDLGIADLRKAIDKMEDGGAGMLGPISMAGCGVEVDVTLPSGISTDQVVTKRRKLAENMGRHEHELFITVPQGKGQRPVVHLWIADPGALDEPVGESPLVLDPSTVSDFIHGRAPWGQDLRGNKAMVSLYQRHVLVTGLSNQGKTAALRALALWAALDPCVELWIADLKGIGDWSMFKGLATVLIEGPTDAHVLAATQMLEAAEVEMQRRTDVVRESGSAKGITEAMARKRGSGLHPLIVIVDEAQVAYMCPGIEPGDKQKRPLGGQKATSRFFMAARGMHNQGRAANTTLWEGTQDPTDENLPKLVREGAHVRASLVLGTESQSKMALGETPVKKGAAPHKLRQGLDKGTLVVVGDGIDIPVGEPSVNVRTHYIDGDAAWEIAEYAKTLRKQVTTRDSIADDDQDKPDLDVLADVATVINGETRVPKQEVMLRLAEVDDRYREFTDARLKAELEAAGAPQYTYNGVTHVHGDRVREALARRFSATE